MRALRELAAAIVTVVAVIGSVFLVAVGWLWAAVGDAPVPEPIRQILNATAAWLPFWIVVAVIAGLILFYRTYKSFKALDDISQLRRDMTQATQTIASLGEQAKRHLDQAERLSDAFWEDSRSGAKVLWEVLYLTACAKPEIEKRLTSTLGTLELWEKGGGVNSINEFEKGPDDFDLTLRNMLGSGPGVTVFGELPDDQSWNPGDYPTRTMWLRKIQGQISCYEHALSAIDRKTAQAATLRYKMLQDPQIGNGQ